MTARAHSVGILVFDGMKMLDLSGPAEVFAEANRFGARYRLGVVSPDGAPVRSSIGLLVPAEADARSAGAPDTLVVVGGDALPGSPVDPRLIDAAKALAAGAGRVRVSPRHLTRMFRAELDVTPVKYVELIRFDIAKALLDSGHNATEAAALSGFPSYESLRRALARHLGLSPTRYRQRFATTVPDAGPRPDGG
ncbi:helix-turn-helix domain-containing protein [Streptomyces sp. SS52]|uniref:helix-turn-helix domain-containing protein n=1 Tax=Streptomyces sp. SS52 TaxID=2563602 RepID=UPI00109E8659|nr:helix-turn-helix domain-containing protein [Streptomyces sp. SS52]QCB26367.1 helix-turn-helix domain-containing protein [Streptomyces sp. SS52]